MKNNKPKIFAQFTAGIFGGTILGIAGFLTMMVYGGNHGCWSVIDSLFGTAGYESCGSFGAIIGMLIGAILGITILSNKKITNYLKTAILLLSGAFLLPFIYEIVIFWPPFEDGDIFIVSPVILMFMLFSSIPSLLITGIINWRNFFGRK
jgi:hypothetical protein